VSPCTLGDRIDLSRLERIFERQPASQRTVTVFQVRSLPSGPFRTSLVLGTLRLLTVDPTEHGGMVTWSVRRGDIQGIALNVEATAVTIHMHRGENKQLSFEAAPACLRFAQAFYRVQTEPAVSTPVRKQMEAEEVRAVKSLVVSTALSPEETQALLKYVQMVEMNVPAGAVRQKMNDDDIHEERLIQAVLEGRVPQGNAPENSTVESKAANYIKMKQMNIPEEALRQKMMQDNASEEVIEYVMKWNSEETPSTSTTSAPVDPLHNDAQKYINMKQMKVPEGAIRQKMMQDGAPENLIEYVLKHPPESGNQADTPPLPPPSSVAQEVASDITSPEDKEAMLPFLAMQKAGVPEAVLRQKMQQEDLNEHLVRLVLHAPQISTAPPVIPSTISISVPEDATPKPTPPLPPRTTAEDGTVMKRFQMMKRMNVPNAAVRRKMELEGIEERLITAVLMNCSPAPRREADTEETHGPASGKKKDAEGGEDDFLKKYRDMKKMNVPDQAIRTKMQRDRVEERLINEILGSDQGSAQKQVPKLTPLGVEDEKIIKKYRMLFAMKVPVEAVRTKMETDKIAKHLIDRLCGKKEGDPAEEETPKDPAEEKKTGATENYPDGGRGNQSEEISHNAENVGSGRSRSQQNEHGEGRFQNYRSRSGSGPRRKTPFSQTGRRRRRKRRTGVRPDTRG